MRESAFAKKHVKERSMNDNNTISWEKDISLLTNPYIVKAWMKAMLATYFLVMLIMSTILIGIGEYDVLPMMALIFAAVVTGLFVFGLLIMLLVLGNRYRARFTVSDKGILYESIDAKSHTMARAAVVAGVLTGRPGAAGAGMLAISQEKVLLKWAPQLRANYHEATKTIAIRNEWRDLLHIYCEEENYQSVSKIIKEKTQANTSEKKVKSSSPIPKAMGHTAMVVISSLILFGASDMFKLDLFLLIFIMLFSLAMVWMIPLFGWVVLPSVGYVLVQIILSLVEMREYTLVNTYRYRGYETLDGAEWALLLFVVLALGYLVLISWRAIKGKFIPVLMRDQESYG